MLSSGMAGAWLISEQLEMYRREDEAKQRRADKTLVDQNLWLQSEVNRLRGKFNTLVDEYNGLLAKCSEADAKNTATIAQLSDESRSLKKTVAELENQAVIDRGTILGVRSRREALAADYKARCPDAYEAYLTEGLF